MAQAQGWWLEVARILGSDCKPCCPENRGRAPLVPRREAQTAGADHKKSADMRRFKLPVHLRNRSVWCHFEWCLLSPRAPVRRAGHEGLAAASDANVGARGP